MLLYHVSSYPKEEHGWLVKKSAINSIIKKTQRLGKKRNLIKVSILTLFRSLFYPQYLIAQHCRRGTKLIHWKPVSHAIRGGSMKTRKTLVMKVVVSDQLNCWITWRMLNCMGGEQECATQHCTSAHDNYTLSILPYSPSIPLEAPFSNHYKWRWSIGCKLICEQLQHSSKLLWLTFLTYLARFW